MTVRKKRVGSGGSRAHSSATGPYPQEGARDVSSLDCDDARASTTIAPALKKRTRSSRGKLTSWRGPTLKDEVQGSNLTRTLHGGKHFPQNPTPRDHLLFLHADLEVDQSDVCDSRGAVAPSLQPSLQPTSQPTLPNNCTGAPDPQILSSQLSLFADDDVQPGTHACERAGSRTRSDANGTTHARYVSVRFAVTGKEGLRPHKDRVGNFAHTMNAQFEGAPSVYLSQADFNSAGAQWYRCRRENLKSIGVIFVDLDYYHARPEIAAMDPQEVSRAIVRTCEESRIAPPLVIHTGNGAYAYWSLSKRLDAGSEVIEQRWKSVQARLMWVLRDFAPDLKVKDLTRVLRVVGTVNAKTGKRVVVAFDDGVTHDFERLEASVKDLQTHPAQGVAAKLGVLTDSSQAVSEDQGERLTPEGELLSWGGEQSASNSRSASDRMGATPPTSREATLEATLGTRTKGNARQHGPRVSELSAPDPQALVVLQKMMDQWRDLSATLGPVRKHHCLRAIDIGSLILMRKGLWRGMRDETLFWLINEMFLAGLCAPDELSALCAQFAGLCEGRLDIWEAGYLKTAHARMVEQMRRAGFTRAQSRVVRKIGCVAAVRPYEAQQFPLDRELAQSLHKKSLAYRARTTTILEKLGVTSREQSMLVVLTDAAERSRRRRSSGVRAKLALRNEGLCAQALSAMSIATSAKRSKSSSKASPGKQSRGVDPKRSPLVHTLSRQSGLSFSSVYRLLGAHTLIQAHRVSTAERRALDRTHALTIKEVIPYLSGRMIAKHLGANVSTVYRWLGARVSGGVMASATPNQLSLDASSNYARSIRKLDTQFTSISESYSLIRVNAYVPVSYVGDDYMGVKTGVAVQAFAQSCALSVIPQEIIQRERGRIERQPPQPPGFGREREVWREQDIRKEQEVWKERWEALRSGALRSGVRQDVWSLVWMQQLDRGDCTGVMKGLNGDQIESRERFKFKLPVFF